jgi:malate dehydrogenase (oxaloacetate-decarboxylating)
MELRLEHVLIRKAITIDSEATVKEASEEMGRLSTSSLVVLSNKRVVGILTTQDVVVRVAAKGLDPEEVLVGDVMSSPVIMMRPETPLGEAIKVMLQRKIKKLPIVSGGKMRARLVGMVSLSDLVEFHSWVFSATWETVLMTVPAVPEEGEYVVA